MSPQDFISQAVQEKLEDMADLALYEQAMAEYRADPVTYSHEEVGKMLGLTP
ncbi:MAG: antitoxin [Selenomonadaceae bacterium]|nr:antitoxin [Selenomonadaceae bacterium]